MPRGRKQTDRRLPEFLTTQEVEFLTTYSQPSLLRLSTQGALPPSKDGQWPLEIIPRVCSYLRGKGGSQASSDAKERKLNAEAEAAEYDAQLKEIAVARARGELVLTEDVKRWSFGIFTALRHGVLGSSLLDTEKDELIASLRKLTERCATPASDADDGTGGDDDTATTDDGEPVGGQVPVS